MSEGQVASIYDLGKPDLQVNDASQVWLQVEAVLPEHHLSVEMLSKAYGPSSSKGKLTDKHTLAGLACTGYSR